MSSETKTDDGVNRDGLQYRAGWVEALRAFGSRLQMEGIRAKKGEIAGLTRASVVAKEMYDAMIAKMKGE